LGRGAPETPKQVHECVVRIARDKGITAGRRMRVDTPWWNIRRTGRRSEMALGLSSPAWPRCLDAPLLASNWVRFAKNGAFVLLMSCH
jgi:hypothetical protein